MKHRLLKAVIFDADGTLLNSRELIMAAYVHVAKQHGLRPPTPEEVMVHMGKSLRDIYAGLFPDYDPDVLVAANSAFILSHAMEVAGYKGMYDLLQALHNEGLRMAIVTGGNHKIEHLLHHHKIDHYFGSVVHSERIARQKPDPEGVLLALQELNAEPHEALMIGDMRYDILAGKNAKVQATIGVTHGFGTRDELQTAGADYIVDNLEAVARLVHEHATHRVS